MENSLQASNPELAKQWHPTRNGSLTPSDVAPFSNKKVWWICDQGHEWQTRVDSRSIGGSCPYCGIRLKRGDKKLETNPDLAREWHPTRNGSLTPKDVTIRSGRKVWWMCGHGHEWEAIIAHRSRGTGCPYCTGKLASKDNCLQTLNPKLASQWHPTRNGSLTPQYVTLYSNKKVWWLCQKGHEWEAYIYNRSRRNLGCPYCAGKLALKDNCLQTLNPSLANQWHPTMNGSLTPSDVAHFSSRKVWWVCDQGHEWQARVSSRSRGKGCPYCTGRKVWYDNRLQAGNPELAKQWHPTMNGSLTPSDVAHFSSRKVWWVCDQGHEWQARVDRRSMGAGCPYCIRKLSPEEVNSMSYAETHPGFLKKSRGKDYDLSKLRGERIG